jgi:exosortase/archaeosortase family protein
LLLAIGTPLLAYGIYLFFDTEAQFWLHEIVVKQTIYFLNFFFNMDVSTSYSPVGKYHWSFDFVGNINGDPLPSIFFETFCTGIQAICVFAGIIICTPHSRDKNTNKDIIWRKAKALVVSSLIFYVVNIIRMLIQIELYYLGYPWDSIHVSISAASSFIAAIIVLLLHKWIPEFIISIIYIGTLISKKFKQLRKPKED